MQYHVHILKCRLDENIKESQAKRCIHFEKPQSHAPFEKRTSMVAFRICSHTGKICEGSPGQKETGPMGADLEGGSGSDSMCRQTPRQWTEMKVPLT